MQEICDKTMQVSIKILICQIHRSNEWVKTLEKIKMKLKLSGHRTSTGISTAQGFGVQLYKIMHVHSFAYFEYRQFRLATVCKGSVQI